MDLEYTELDLFVHHIGRDVVQKAIIICMCQNSIAVIFVLNRFFYQSDALVQIGFLRYYIDLVFWFIFFRGGDLHTLLCVRR